MRQWAGRSARGVFAIAWMLFSASSLFAAYTVTGKFEYEDREFNLSGFTGVLKRRPIRFADVRILAEGVEVARGVTTAGGEFLITVPDLVVPTLSAVCVASSSQTPGLALNVRVANDNFSFGDYYGVSSATFSTQGPSGIVAMGTTTAKAGTDVGKAFNIWDVLTDGIEFIASAQAHGNTPPANVTAIWRETHTRTGSFYKTGPAAYLYIGSDSGYNDTVIAHEFGHFIEDSFSRSDNPGGSHVVGDNTQDMRLSWSEGLATFLGSSIRKFKGYPNPEIYVSTDGTNLSFSYELESLQGNIAVLASKTGSTNEIAVSAALWDITDGIATHDDSPGTDDDPVERSFAEVWKDLTQYIALVQNHAVTVEDFWDGWFAVRNGGSLVDMQTVFAEIHGMEFLPDPLEGDDPDESAPRIGAARIAPLTSGGGVRINELDLGRVDAVELFNASGREVDLTGWRLLAIDQGGSITTFVIPNYRLAPGAFVVLSEANGFNTDTTLFFGRNITWANGEDGACLLLDGYAAGRDFVRWGNSGISPPAETGFSALNPASPTEGRDLGRNFASVDTDDGSDWTEQGPSPGTYNMGGNELHLTYYPAQDVDLVAFQAKGGAEYLAETFNLANGAQTILEILAPDAQTVLASVKHPSMEPGSARHSWKAPVSGTYYIRSRGLNGATNRARYGSYDLRLAEKAPLLVRKSLGGDFNTLGAAIGAAADGDTIEIQDSSIYRENITVDRKNLTLRAARGHSPVLDGGNDSLQAALELNADNLRIEGIRIRHGASGLRIARGTAILVDTVVYHASGPAGRGEGIRIEGPFASATLIHCTIAGNAGPAVAVLQGSSVRIANSILVGNQQPDLFSDGSAIILEVSHSLFGSSAPELSNGNRIADPRFVNLHEGDFHLSAGSPAIDQGDGAQAEIPSWDADGISRNLDGDGNVSEVPDMGAYEFLRSEALTAASILPQVAVGDGYKTSMIAINTAGQTTQARLEFAGADGQVLSQAILGWPGPGPLPSLPPGGMIRLEASLGENVASGYGRLLASIPVDGSALFQVVQGSRVVSEAGVGPAKAASRFAVYVDNSRSARSGYALANPDLAPANLSLTLFDKNGVYVTTSELLLAAQGHLAEFAYQRFREAGNGFEGMIEFASDRPLYAVALRYENEAQDVFSTIPVLANELTSHLHFPLVADGAGYRTNFILVNPAESGASVRLEFFAQDGTPLALSISGALRTSLDIFLGPKSSASHFTDAVGTDINAGWAKVTSAVPIAGAAVIQMTDGRQILSEAGFAAASPAGRLLSYIDSHGSAASGVAICNPNTEAVRLNLRLRNAAGEIVAAKSQVLSRQGQVAKFFTEWFPFGFHEFEGTLEVTSLLPAAAVALRFDNPLLDVFAALPVVIIR